ncbi:mCG145346, partial [Mus musculus]
VDISHHSFGGAPSEHSKSMKTRARMIQRASSTGYERKLERDCPAR